MTDHEAADLLIGLTVHTTMRCSEALCRGAAALRQPRLPDRWPLAWERGRVAGEPCWHGKCLGYHYGVMASRGAWLWYVGEMTGQCRSTAWSARRAAARAVARAVKESLKGGRK